MRPLILPLLVAAVGFGSVGCGSVNEKTGPKIIPAAEGAKSVPLQCAEKAADSAEKHAASVSSQSQPVAQPSASASATSASVVSQSTATNQANAGQAALPSNDANQPRRYALTISGGLSIGSFEAGLTWALVRSLKAHRAGQGRNLGTSPVELVATTGASAGNINALLTAIEWCQKDEIPDSLDDNPFAQAWLDVGLEQLLPGWMTCEEYKDHFDKEAECGPNELAYAPGDGAFSRRPLQKAERNVKRIISQPNRFIAGCKMPVGVTVTSERISYFKSSDIDHHGRYGVRVPTQLYSIVFRAEAEEKGLAMKQWLTAPDPTFGNTLYVAQGESGRMSEDTLMGVIEASSAFPIAFGMKTLPVCEPQLGTSAKECEPGGTGKWENLRFFDGGLYDNVPLGLAMYLVDPPKQCQRGNDAWDRHNNVHYLFLDPDTVRRQKRHAEVEKPAKEGVPLLVDLLGRFVDVSRKYELQTALRHLLSSRPGSLVEPITRSVPLMSSHASNFGGFFAKSFRVYDYYVGIYEGLHSAAQEACDNPELVKGPLKAHLACQVKEMVRLHNLLGLNAENENAKTASYVVRKLVRREAEITFLRPNDTEPFLAGITITGPSGDVSLSEWTNQGTTNDEITQVILAKNLELDKTLRDTTKPMRDIGIEDLEAILASLKDAVAKKIETDQSAGKPKNVLDYRLTRHEKQMFADFKTWAWHRAARLTERLAYMAEKSNDSASKSVFGGLNFILHEMESPEPGWTDWNATKMSNCKDCGAQWARILPYEVNFPRTGGLEIGYRFNAYLNRTAALTVPLRPWSWTDYDQRHSAKLGLGVLLLTGNSALLSSVDFNPNFEVDYKKSPTGKRIGWGGEVGTNHVFRHLRVSLSIEDMPFTGKMPTNVYDHLQLRFGFSDVSSLVYWFARLLCKAKSRDLSHSFC